MRRIDQHLAIAAADALRRSGIEPSNTELRSRMSSLPALLQSSGLMATCAFLLAKDRTGDLVAVRALLAEAANAVGMRPDGEPGALLDDLAKIDEHRLAMAEQRAAMLGTWLSRLANARFKATQRAPAS
jgi:CRISPR/Cas system CMR-associated protein Cmr5 small subunit